MPSLTFPFFLALALRLAASLQWGVLIYRVRQRPEHTNAPSLMFQAYALSVIGYLLNLLAYLFAAPLIVTYGFIALAFASGPLFWLCAKSFFEDSFRPRAYHAVLVLLSVALAFLTHSFLPTSALFYRALEGAPLARTTIAILFPQIITLFFVGLSIWEVQKGKSEDLVETRLQYRRLFIWAAAITIVIVDIGEYATKFSLPGLNYCMALVFLWILAVGYIITQNIQHPTSSLLARKIIQPEIPQAPLSSEAQQMLTRLMEEDKVYLRPDMNLENLARLIKLPEYRVRRHINQVLGHQNFSQFLNHYRVREAKRILRDPQTKSIPIYNLAMDLGYGSVISFQRAFRESVGMAPTEFKESAQS